MIPPQEDRLRAARRSQAFGFDEEPALGPVRRTIRAGIVVAAVAGFIAAAVLPFLS